jgi:NADH:ubiquinone oxidoreductase subunit
MQYRTYNGIPATDLVDVRWQKSHRSNSQGNCVELAQLPDGNVAVRNSRHPAGPALVYTKSEMRALVEGAKAGDFDRLLV